MWMRSEATTPIPLRETKTITQRSEGNTPLAQSAPSFRKSAETLRFLREPMAGLSDLRLQTDSFDFDPGPRFGKSGQRQTEPVLPGGTPGVTG